jgi:hypothetical protein
MTVRVRGRVALALATLVVSGAGCQTNVGDAGCRINRQLVFPPTELTQLPEARLEPLDANRFVLIGHDGSAVRWAVLSWLDGTIGAEQTLPLPAGYRAPIYALGNLETFGDTVQVGVLTDAANGTDAELHLITVPLDGPTTVAPGGALVTFAGAAGTVPQVALATGRLGTNAGLAWVDPAEGVVNYAPIDGTGAMVGSPNAIDSGQAFRCLAFSAGNDNVTASYQRFPDATSPPSWMISEVNVEGMFTNWSLPLAGLGGSEMRCAMVTPTPRGYGLAWQDATGSWLSVLNAMDRRIQTYPFASATDFGGPDVQPPIVGLAPFPTGSAENLTVDFGVAFQRPRAVEVWRLDDRGIRQPGALLLPSLEGNMGNASSVVVGQSLVITYADYTPAAQTGRRLLVDASCY